MFRATQMFCHSSMGGNAERSQRLAERPGDAYHSKCLVEAGEVRVQLYQRGEFFYSKCNINRSPCGIIIPVLQWHHTNAGDPRSRHQEALDFVRRPSPHIYQKGGV